MNFIHDDINDILLEVKYLSESGLNSDKIISIVKERCTDNPILVNKLLTQAELLDKIESSEFASLCSGIIESTNHSLSLNIVYDILLNSHKNNPVDCAKSFCPKMHLLTDTFTDNLIDSVQSPEYFLYELSDRRLNVLKQCACETTFDTIKQIDEINRAQEAIDKSIIRVTLVHNSQLKDAETELA